MDQKPNKSPLKEYSYLLVPSPTGRSASIKGLLLSLAGPACLALCYGSTLIQNWLSREQRELAVIYGELGMGLTLLLLPSAAYFIIKGFWTERTRLTWVAAFAFAGISLYWLTLIVLAAAQNPN